MATAKIMFIIFLLVLLLLILLAILIMGIIIVYSSIISKVPLVPARRKSIDSIIKALDLKPGDILYDLGSGDGRILSSALDKHSDIKAVGLEIGPWPRLISKIKIRKYGDRVKILNQDFYKADLSEATHIFMYLYPKIMKKLEVHFDQTLKPGVRLVSCDFPFPNKKPDQVITIPGAKTLSKTLYIYTW